MPQFAYKAKKDDGSVVTGTLQAESERSALDSLGRMGVFPLEIESRAEDKAAARNDRAPRQVARSVGSNDVALFTRQLADLMRAGVPLKYTTSCGVKPRPSTLTREPTGPRLTSSEST